ncbi:unnamed protein product [Closterium sp. NIES-54]
MSWRSTQSSSMVQSSAEAEIYTGAMAVQELCWLTLLTNGVKHIDVWYFFLQELQRHGQARLDFVVSAANTADIFTKALPPVPDPQSNRARAASPTVSRLLATVVTDPYSESTTASALVAELVDFATACTLDYATSLVAESESAGPPSVGDPDALDIPTLCSYAEAITGHYSSQWQAAIDAEMASWKSTGTYVDAVPPSEANVVDDMWIFRVKRPPGSPPAFKARYVARGFSQRQGVDYFQTFSPTPKMTTLRVLLHVAAQCDNELHSLDLSTAFLQGSLHVEIWLHRPPRFTGSFPAGT